MLNNRYLTIRPPLGRAIDDRYLNNRVLDDRCLMIVPSTVVVSITDT